ncbi:MAG TPA: adenylyl-sulfate kinase [Bacteroidia bacterium]|jgi:adenylylsulfate kinase|nr:adenylyl-sulfate kinase [Bacteroidia bacterium]
MNNDKNIHPIFSKLVQRSERESLLKQKAKVIWMTGLSGSGKSTLAIGLERTLLNAGKLAYVLDGDNVRSGINSNLGFTEEDRKENIRRVAEVAKLLVDSGVIVICSFVSPTIEIRSLAKNIIGEKDFLEVYVNASLAVCEKRDVKGLYAKARSGLIKDFTGIHQAFEAPEDPALEINTENNSLEQSLNTLLEFVHKHI